MSNKPVYINVTAKQLALNAVKSHHYNPIILGDDGKVWGKARNIRFARRSGRRCFSLVEMTVNGREAQFQSTTVLKIQD